MFRNRRWLIFLAVPLILGVALALLNGRRPQALPLDHSPMAPIAISPDNNLIATNKGGQVDIIEVYDRSQGRSTQFRTSSCPSNFLFLPDNRTLVSVGDAFSRTDAVSRSVQAWDTKVKTEGTDQAQPLRKFGPELAMGGALALSPDGKTLATGGFKGVLLWDIAQGRVAATLDSGGYAPQSLSFSRDGQRLAAAFMGAGTNARFWDVAARKLLWSTSVRPVGGSFDVTSSAISPDGNRVVLGSQSGRIALLDGATGKMLKLGDLPPSDKFSLSPLDAARSVAFSPDGKTIISGGWGEAAVWNAADSSVNRLFPGSAPPVFSSDGKLLATGGAINAKNGVILWKSW